MEKTGLRRPPVNAGKHVISEADMTGKELEKPLEVVKRTRLQYMMAETGYFRPETLTCMELNRQGKFGTIFCSEAEFHHAGSVECFQWDGIDCQSCHLGSSEQANKL
jgi:hypothetical protein